VGALITTALPVQKFSTPVSLNNSNIHCINISDAASRMDEQETVRSMREHLKMKLESGHGIA
jgi:hypothetical protein